MYHNIHLADREGDIHLWRLEPQHAAECAFAPANGTCSVPGCKVPASYSIEAVDSLDWDFEATISLCDDHFISHGSQELTIGLKAA